MKIKKISVQAVFAFLSLLLIPMYTLSFGMMENPWENTLSGIGNKFDHRLSFIVWGIITGMAILYQFFYIYEKMDFSDKRARRYMIASQVFLVMTVFTPALKSVFPVWHFIHVLFANFFAIFLIISVLLFIQFLSRSNQRLSKTALYTLISCVGVSVIALFIMGLNGVVEILFFIGIAVFMTILRIILNKFTKEKERKARELIAEKAKKKPSVK